MEYKNMKHYWKRSKDKSGFYICSNCGAEISYIDRNEICPNCNTKMIGFEVLYRNQIMTWEKLKEREDEAVKQFNLEYTMEWIK